MGYRPTLQFTTGPAGSGKSYVQCAHFLVNVWLVDGGSGVHYSNFPVKFDPWTDANGVERPGLVAVMAEKGIDEETVRARVKCFADDVDLLWRNDGKTKTQKLHGPWDYFEGQSLAGAHIAIDECHHYCGERSPAHVKAAWQKWYGEIRHQGATVEFLSQTPQKVDKNIRDEAELRIVLSSAALSRDPVFNVAAYDYWQFLAKFSGVYVPSFTRREMRQVVEKWTVEQEETFYVDENLFGVYDSFSGPKAGGRSGAGGLHPYQKYSWPGLVLWFLKNNFFRVIPRVALYVFLVVLVLNGKHVLPTVTAFLQSSLTKPKASVETTSTSVKEARAMGQEVVNADIPDQVKIKALQAQMEALARESAVIADKLAASELEKEQVVAELRESFALVCLTNNQVTFRSGFSYSVGETVDLGPYKGLTISKVDYARRLCVLSDGRVLRMGHGLQSFDPDPKAPAARVSSPLPETRSNGGTPTPAPSQPETAKRFNGGDALR